jgi:hypothetical protein
MFTQHHIAALPGQRQGHSAAQTALYHNVCISARTTWLHSRSLAAARRARRSERRSPSDWRGAVLLQDPRLTSGVR